MLLSSGPAGLGPHGRASDTLPGTLPSRRWCSTVSVHPHWAVNLEQCEVQWVRGSTESLRAGP